nr:GNAT family protein [Pseudaestuariivita rosea]
MLKAVELVAPSLDHVEQRMSYPSSPEIIRMYGGEPTRSLQTSRTTATRWVQKLIDHPCAWVITADGRIVGQARLDDINQKDQKARLALGLLSEGDLGKGIGRQAIQKVLDYAFEEITLNRVDLRVLAFNKRAIRCYMACGFIEEGRERESARISGKWYDDIIMGILKREHLSRKKDV